MNDDERSIQKNKLIITVSILILVFIVVGYILLNSNINDTVYFHYIYNQKTGEPIGLVGSIFLYLLFWFFICGGLPSGVVALFSLYLYSFLHRKDKKLFHRSYHPKYEEECFYGATVSFIATYTAAFILMVLHISNLVTINIGLF